MSLRKKSVIVLGAFGSVLVGSAAYAYWTSTGSGTGTATAGASATYVVQATVASTPLTPGGAPAEVTVNVTNPAAGAQQVNQIVLSVTAIAPGRSNEAKPACAIGDFELTNPVTNPTAPLPRSLGSGATAAWAGTITLKNTEANQDNCQGVTITVKADVS